MDPTNGQWGANLNPFTGIGSGGYNPFAGWFGSGSGDVPDASGSGTDNNGVGVAMFGGDGTRPYQPMVPKKPSSPGSSTGVIPRQTGTNGGPPPVADPTASQISQTGTPKANLNEECGGVDPEAVNPGSNYRRGGSSQPPAATPQPPSSPLNDGGPGDAIVGAGEGGTSWDDGPAAGGVFNYVWNAGAQVFKGDYTPDSERNALGTGLEVVAGFSPLGVVQSARDLTQNVTNWEWTVGHALKTGTNVAGLLPGVKGIVTLVKGAKGVTGTAKALNAAGKLADAQTGIQKANSLLKILNKACFAAGTPLLTPVGSRPIEELQIDDLVLSRDEYNPEGPVVARRVVKLFQNYSPLLDVHVGRHAIRTTAEHPFWVIGKGWTDAHQIVIGDLLLGADGECTAVEAIDGPKEPAHVYNVEVEEYHTYFVGSTVWGFAVWAHNDNDCLRKLVDAALGSTAPATRLEGKVGNHLFDRLTAFRRQVLGTNGNPLGEIDVAVPEAIIEVTTGNKGKVVQVTKLLTDTTMNPTGLPVIVFAPNFKKKRHGVGPECRSLRSSEPWRT